MKPSITRFSNMRMVACCLCRGQTSTASCSAASSQSTSRRAILAWLPKLQPDTNSMLIGTSSWAKDSAWRGGFLNESTLQSPTDADAALVRLVLALWNNAHTAASHILDLPDQPCFTMFRLTDLPAAKQSACLDNDVARDFCIPVLDV